MYSIRGQVNREITFSPVAPNLFNNSFCMWCLDLAQQAGWVMHIQTRTKAQAWNIYECIFHVLKWNGKCIIKGNSTALNLAHGKCCRRGCETNYCSSMPVTGSSILYFDFHRLRWKASKTISLKQTRKQNLVVVMQFLKCEDPVYKIEAEDYISETVTVNPGNSVAKNTSKVF